MATWEDVRRLALALPGTDEHVSRGNVHWRVKDKNFVWERPLRKADLAALGPTAPKGPILGVRTVDEGAREALLASDPRIYFTIPHFDVYPAVLVRLEQISLEELDELIAEAWSTRAPRRLVEDHFRSQ